MMHVCSSNEKINKLKKENNYKLNLLIGSPNVGKSSFFNRITWQNSCVSNIDKTTTTTKIGSLRFDKTIKILDLPGVYSLDPNTQEEEIVIEYLLNKEFDKVVNIISATSLKRDLMLTISLLETGLLDNIIINMIDEVGENSINQFKLIRKLGVNVDNISVLKNKGIKLALNNIINFSNKKSFSIAYPENIEKIISLLEEQIKQPFNVSNRFLAIQFLEANNYIQKLFHELKIFDKCINIIKQNGYGNLNETKKIIRNTKNIFINQIYLDCIDETKKESLIKKSLRTSKIDKFILNKWIGIPLFILVMFLIYYLSFGPYAGGWITEQLTNGLDKLSDIINNAMLNSNISGFWANFVTNGLLGGIFTVLGFLPYIIFIFSLLFILEQTGFLSRISVLLDKTFERFGLSGRSIVTLLTGVGCNIVSVLSARNSQSIKEKRIIYLISPLIACSARLVVFNWIASALVGINLAWIVSFSLTVFSGIIALLLGYFFSINLFRKRTTFFLTELPPWRLPRILLLLKSVGNELWGFIKRVLTLIAIVNLVIFLLSNISPRTGLINEVQYNAEFNYQTASLLEYISLGFKYIFYPIGLGEDWRLSMSLISAAPAKEIAASNLELLFGSPVGFYDSLNNLKSSVGTSLSYFLFFSFYTPCLSTSVVLKKESGTKWMLIHLITAFLFSYLLSFVVFNLSGTFQIISHNSLFTNSVFNIFNLSFFSFSVLFLIINLVFYLKYKQNKITKILIYISISLILIVCILMCINIYTFK